MEDRNVGEPNKVQLEDAHNPYNDSVDSGLEVVAPSYSQLPVVVEDYTQLYSIASEQLNEKIIQSEQEKDTEKIAYHADDKFLVTKKKWHISRRRVHLAMAVLILVIAAIIGTVVGVVVQRRHSSGSGASGNGGSKQADHDNLVWSQTSLAVTGWRHADGAAFSIRLFYQDADGFIRMSNMESTSADSWTSGTKVAKAKRGTPLAAACTNQSTYTPGKTAMETHVFYLDETSQLREHVFRDDDLTGFSGPLSAQNITPASDTRLAAYWPSVTYQNADLTFSEARFNCTRTSTNCWDTTNLKIAGPGPSAAIGLIPMGTNHFGMWMFYQREDADLVNSAWNNASTAWGRRDFNILFPRSHPVSVFAMPSAADGTMLDFHILYQDTDESNISWVWRERGEWHGTTKDEALKSARRGTSMACLTPESLDYSFDMSRCYFLGDGGRVRSVHWVDKEWKDLGVAQGVGNRNND